jgi:hypothetical protein
VTINRSLLRKMEDREVGKLGRQEAPATPLEHGQTAMEAVDKACRCASVRAEVLDELAGMYAEPLTRWLLAEAQWRNKIYLDALLQVRDGEGEGWDWAVDAPLLARAVITRAAEL